MDDDEFPATQPVLPSVLADVVAYVEVRSGHDNRSRGVISELRSLGANIAPTLNKDVTHVVFQGGHVSTYKKAKQLMCNVVAVSWIEASKDLGNKAPEEEHPPPGFKQYEDPDAARRIKVLKSMQPDFDDEKDDERLNAVLARIKKGGAKRSASTESDVCDTKDKHAKKKNTAKRNNGCKTTDLCRSLDRIAEESKNETNTGRSKKRMPWAGSKTTSSFKNIIPPKRSRNSSARNVKLYSHCGDPFPIYSCSTSSKDENRESGNRKMGLKPSNSDDKQKNGIVLSVHDSCTSDMENSERSFEFVVPKPLKNNKLSNSAILLTANKQIRVESQVSSSESHLFIHTERKSGGKTQESSKMLLLDQKTKESPLPSSTGNSIAQSRPLVFIENIREDHTTSDKKIDLEAKSPQLITPARQTRRSSGLAGSHLQIHPSTGNKERSSDINRRNPFVTRVLEALSNKKSRKIYVKSPWRQENDATLERRQSPRLRALQKEKQLPEPLEPGTRSSGSDSDADHTVSPKKTREPGNNNGLGSASAVMFKLWKAKPSKRNSPELALLDMSFGPEKRPASSACPQPAVVDERRSSKQGIPKCEESSLKSLEDRSNSPILGTRVKHRLTKSVLSSSSASAMSLLSPRGTPLEATSASKLNNVSTLDGTKTPVHHQLKKKIEQRAQDDICLSNSIGNSSEQEEKSMSASFDLSTRPSRKRSTVGFKEQLPTLVCTHLNKSDVKRVMKAVGYLGKFEFEEQVTERTTHLVASGPRRTINMLRAICRGCWILTDNWVYQSVKAKRWLPEEDFELTEFSPMAQKRRILRQSASGIGQWDLLSSVGPIFVSQTCLPRPAELKDLIVLSGASVARTAEKAALILRPPPTKSSSKKKYAQPQVAPVWLLDSIVKGEKLPLLSSPT